MCLLPTRKACDDFNNSMLTKAGSLMVKINSIDEYDETGGIKWTKKASVELGKMNNDCNMTARLEAELVLAVGARVMLHQNIDTSSGLVNGALGIVTSIYKDSIEVTFDPTPNTRFKIASEKSKFQVV